jgi:hypothetical protein
MKTLFGFILISTIVACQQATPEKPLSMAGAYTMTRQVLNDGTKDSLLDRSQLKIFTDKYVMYASPNLTDSFANFGIGRYHVTDNRIVEEIFYTTSPDKRDSSVLMIENNVNGYKQEIEHLPIGGKDYKLTEEYQNVGSAISSPLDGAWKQVRNVYIPNKGDSSVNTTPIEYKMYQSGYFIWAITTKDSAQKNVSVFGYGTFDYDGKNKSKETMMNSTFLSTKGKAYDVAVEMKGRNAYRQTITFANGDRSIEYYERITD